jgi:16S rRNA processing protein RimM
MTSSRKSVTRRRDNSPPSPELLVVGVLVGPHGIQGETKLRPFTETPERLSAFKRLRLRFPNGNEEFRDVLGSRWHKGHLLVRLEGVSSIEDSDALRGAEVVITLEEAPPLPEGQYYEHQLLGLRVLTPDGEELGTVTEILPGASNDVYVAGKWMIPATHDAIIRLAPEEGIIVVRSREYLEGEEVR